MSLFDAYAQVGAAYGLPIFKGPTVFDVPHELYRVMTANWNERQLTPEQRQEQTTTLHTFSDGT